MILELLLLAVITTSGFMWLFPMRVVVLMMMVVVLVMVLVVMMMGRMR